MGLLDFFRERRARKFEDRLPRETMDPDSIRSQLELADLPLRDARLEELRRISERFALGEEGLPDLLPATVALVVTRHIDSMLADDAAQADADPRDKEIDQELHAIDEGAALSTVLLGVGVRVGEHCAPTPPKALEFPPSSQSDPQTLHATAQVVAQDPTAYFALGRDAWTDLRGKAWMTGAAATRALSGGFASPIPYDEFFAFGYGLGCALDYHVPEWIKPLKQRIIASPG